MASKKEEMAAFLRLKKAFPDDSVSIGCQYDNFSQPVRMSYSAYRNGGPNIDRRSSTHGSTDSFVTPKQAVDWLIERSPDARDTR